MRRTLVSLFVAITFLFAVPSGAGSQNRFSVTRSSSLAFISAPLPKRIADAQRAQQKFRLRIMPLGDSITFGSPDPSYGGYRHLLGTLLMTDGYSLDFVGSRRSGDGFFPGPDNEGHPGWTIPQVKIGIDSNDWLETYRPDIILLHIGTNDIREGDTASAPGNLTALLDDILARLPQTHIIVAQIISFRRGPDRDHLSYNTAISRIVAARGPRVSLVDLQNILSKDDYADGFHPNAGGYDKIAHAWELAIRAVKPPPAAPQPRSVTVALASDTPLRAVHSPVFH